MQGTLTHWLPAEDTDPALWRVTYPPEEGDETGFQDCEDLERGEVEKGFKDLKVLRGETNVKPPNPEDVMVAVTLAVKELECIMSHDAKGSSADR